MGKIFYIMGKSASGKDTVFRRLLERDTLHLEELIPYTTRPMRDGERQGREYRFTDEAVYREFEREGRLIESRSYHTVHGVWIYFTADDGGIDLEWRNYLGIGTLESFVKIKEYFGEEKVIPVYLEVEDGERLIRAVRREQGRKTPDYQELCRRFLADSNDFSEENIRKAGVNYRFVNLEMEDCLTRIESYIQDMI